MSLKYFLVYLGANTQQGGVANTPLVCLPMASRGHRLTSVCLQSAETSILLPNNQRQHRTSHARKDVLPLRICANYCAPCPQPAGTSCSSRTRPPPRAVPTPAATPLTITRTTIRVTARTITRMITSNLRWRRAETVQGTKSSAAPSSLPSLVSLLFFLITLKLRVE